MRSHHINFNIIYLQYQKKNNIYAVCSVQNKSLSLCIQERKIKKNTKFTLELIYESKIAMSKNQSLTSHKIITKKNKAHH